MSIETGSTVSPAPKEIVFVENNLPDLQSVLAGLRAGVEVVLLDSTGDGLAQIAGALSARSGIDAIHIVSHGAPGALDLGSTTLSAATLAAHADALGAIGASLAAGGDILLYACDTGAGSGGTALLNGLASLTQADIAASTDLTGAAASGGDWVLEQHTGEIAAPLAFTDAFTAQYEHLLVVNAPPTISHVDVIMGGQEDTPGVITFADLLAAADEADTDGSVTAFHITGFYSGGTLFKVGTSLATAGSGINDVTIDATHNLYYTPAADYNTPGIGSGIAMIEVQAVDNMGQTSFGDATVYVNLAPVNDAPTVAYGTNVMGVAEDVVSLDHEDVSDTVNHPPANWGSDIADLIRNSGFQDKESSSAAGIAVSGNAADPLTQGRWQYSTDQNSEYWHDIGTVSDSAALLLASGSTSTTYLRFVPVAEYSGTPGALTVHGVDVSGQNSLQFSDWDGTTEQRHTFDTTAVDATSPVSATGVEWVTSVYPVNDAPVLTGLDSTDNQTVFSSDGAALIDSTQDIALTDIDTPSFGNGYISVTIAAGRAAGDMLAIQEDGNVSLSAGMSFGSQVSVGGAVVGTIAYGSTGANQDLALYLTGTPTPADIATLLRHISFDTTGSVAGDRTINMQVFDGNGASVTGSTVVSVAVAPMVAITTDNLSVTAGETANITFTFSETPTGFDSSDIAVVGGSLSGLAQSSGNPNVYTAVFTPDAGVNGVSGSVSIAAGKFTGVLGTDNRASTGNAHMTVDTVAPTVTISADKTTVKAGDTVALTFTFNETPSYFNAYDIGYGGGTVSNFSPTSDSKVYTATFTPQANLDSVHGLVFVGGGGYMDAAGNAGGASNTINVTGDTRAPGVIVTADKTVLKAGDTVALTFTFTETPAGFSADDITHSGGTLSNFQGTANARVYTATFTPDASGNLAAMVGIGPGAYLDAAGNSGMASNLLSFSGDTVAPTVAIGSSATSLKAGETANLTFTFSEAPTGFDAGDVQVSGGTLGPVTVSTSDAKVYTATFTPTPGVDGVNASIAVTGGSYTDGAANAGAGDQLSIAVDTLAPSLTITSDKSVLHAGETATVSFSFSEAPLHFDASDLAVSGGTLGAVSVTSDPKVYTATFTPSATDAVNGSVGLATVRYTDTAGNPGSGANALTFSGDTRAPALVISADKTSLHAGESAALTLTFSETPTGFGAGDIDYAGGTLGNFQATSDAKVFTATFTPDASGNLDAWVSVSAGVWGDAGGNGGGASNRLAFGGDTLAPAVTSIAPAGTPAASATAVDFSVTLSESVTGVDAGDFSLTATGATTGHIASVTGSGATYTVTVDGIAGNGTLRLDLNGNNTGIIDHADNALGGGYAAGTAHTASFNAAPEIVSNNGGAGAAIAIAEGSTQVTTVAATDADHDTLSYSITGGADAALFQIDAQTGVLALRTAQQFAAPADSDHDGRYEVQVGAADNQGGSDTQALTVTVLKDLDGDGVADIDDTDIDNDGGNNSVEDGVSNLNGGHGDGNGDGRADSAQINVASLPTAAAGAPYATLAVADGLTLTAVSAGPAPAGLPRNVKLPLGVLDFTIGGVSAGGTAEVSIYVDSAVQANGYFKQDNSGKWVNIATSVVNLGAKTKITFDLTDGGIYDSDHSVNGRIVDPGGAASISPLVTSNGGALTAATGTLENTSAVTTVTAASVGPVSFAIAGGADAALFQIDALTGVLAWRQAPDYEQPASAAHSNQYVVQVSATNAVGSDVQTLTVSVLDDPETPLPVATTVDGVTVQTGTVANSDGSTSQVVTVPVVTDARNEQVGNNNVADIPLAGNGATPLLAAQLPSGYGLTASGGASQPAGASLEQLIKSIVAATPGHSATDQGHLTGNGADFLGHLNGSVPLLVQTITPNAPAQVAAPLVLTGTSDASQHTALVIDTSNLPSGSQLVLNAVDFAAVIGAASVTGNTSGQILTGDAASQTFTVAAGTGGSVFSGGGNDRLAFESAAAAAAPASAAGRASAAAAPVTTVLHGGLDGDAVVFNGKRADYTIEQHDGYLVVTANGHPDQHALAVNVENLQFADTTFTVENRAALSTIAGLYQDALGRQADYQGFDFWGAAQKNGASLGQIALEILGSQEAQALHGWAFTGNAGHDIDVLYQGVFGRHGDAGGLAFWTDAMAHGMSLEAVAQAFVVSAEAGVHLIGAANWDFQV